MFLHMMRMWTESKAAASQQEADALMNAYAVAGDKKAPPRYHAQLLAVNGAGVCDAGQLCCKCMPRRGRDHLSHCMATAHTHCATVSGCVVCRQQFGGRGLGQALEQLAAPLKLGSMEFVPLFAKLGSALSLSSGACHGRPCAPSRLVSWRA